MHRVEDHDVELETLQSATMEDEDEGDSSRRHLNRRLLEDGEQTADGDNFADIFDSQLDRRTKRKLDLLLLPLLAILFLLNSMDKSNIGNAETAGFTRDAGLSPNDLNISMSYFFAFFVALQPVGAALGRKFGMVRWVPACMSLWGLCTLLHIWVNSSWQLILLRIAIACLEAGFYPTTVAYLSLFYTRYEFGVRLSFFYGQTAVAGMLGGVLSWLVFSSYEGQPDDIMEEGWKGWQTLFLIEGSLTMFVALLGFFWLPKSAETAWFFNVQERRWAEQRIRIDFSQTNTANASRMYLGKPNTISSGTNQEGEERDEAHHSLLPSTSHAGRRTASDTTSPITADAGLSKQDILSAISSRKIWHLLLCNILSAIPATAFGVFLPLVIKQLSPALNIAPSTSNLLTAPPFAFGAAVLLIFARWSDRSKRRLIPIFCGLGLLVVGLAVTILVPMGSYILRYVALCILLSGSYIASPLTVAWITNNTPEPGKRSILLGINGWGNLAGVFLLVLFTPEDRDNGYVGSLAITLFCALASFAGYVVFWFMLRRENRQRHEIVSGWSVEEKEREDRAGDVELSLSRFVQLRRRLGLTSIARKLGFEESRQGDEKMTFRPTFYRSFDVHLVNAVHAIRILGLSFVIYAWLCARLRYHRVYDRRLATPDGHYSQHSDLITVVDTTLNLVKQELPPVPQTLFTYHAASSASSEGLRIARVLLFGVFALVIRLVWTMRR